MSDELPTARSLRALFSQIAVLREYQEADDPRCADAACNLHLLAATVADVPADVIVRLNEPASASVLPWLRDKPSRSWSASALSAGCSKTRRHFTRC